MNKLVLLAMFSTFTAMAQEPTPTPYPPGTVLVVAPAQYQFASIQIAAGIQGGVPVETSLVQTFAIAKSNPNVTGIIDISLATDQAWETGRVVCYARTGEKAWQEKVFFNAGGGAERIAEKFTDKLAEKTRGRSCP